MGKAANQVITDDDVFDGDTPAPAPATKKGDNVSQAARSLASYVQRIERMEEEQKALAADKKLIYDEAKARGYDVKVMREVVKRRRKDREAVEEFDATLATYETNLDSVMD